jgi:hypothetical protein
MSYNSDLAHNTCTTNISFPFSNKKHVFRIHSIEFQNPSVEDTTGTSLQFWNTRYTYEAVCSQMRLFQR